MLCFRSYVYGVLKGFAEYLVCVLEELALDLGLRLYLFSSSYNTGTLISDYYYTVSLRLRKVIYVFIGFSGVLIADTESSPHCVDE